MTGTVEIILIGGSAGSLDILLKMLPHLEKNGVVPIVVILHRKNSNDSMLTDLLNSRTTLEVMEADEKQPMLPGVVYIAPADYHLLIERDKTFSLDASEKVNYSRPSIDVTFQSAADVFGKGVAAVLLSGANADGVEGLKTIRKAGGYIIVQNPAFAAVPYMPQQAINSVEVDLIMGEDDLPGMWDRILNISSR